jgi:hypothetical protein
LVTITQPKCIQLFGFHFWGTKELPLPSCAHIYHGENRM